MNEQMEMQKQKNIIRKETIRRLRDQDPSVREEKSKIIQEKLLSSEEFRASRTVMIYVSLSTEVNTEYVVSKALEQGKRVAVPYLGSESETITASELVAIEHLEQGPYGINQPANGLDGAVPLKEIDLIVVPAIAYDNSNMRLGRGKGYYDRFLSEPALSSVPTIGLAFSFQVTQILPSDSHDRPVTMVITE
ncbi:MAG: 5-formyltetrahydrofolate cyclo-ligase [Candidatus Tantalella remota]|nr:5-formyltetrahydrofolate cyclo-ligase [Candidatus Tantalella remota]